MKTDYKLLERLAEIHAEATVEFKTDDLAFIMGRKTCEKLCAMADRLYHFGPTTRHEGHMLFGCPVYVTYGAGVLCVRRQCLTELVFDVQRAINAEIERVARDGKES